MILTIPTGLVWIYVHTIVFYTMHVLFYHSSFKPIYFFFYFVESLILLSIIKLNVIVFFRKCTLNRIDINKIQLNCEVYGLYEYKRTATHKTVINECKSSWFVAPHLHLSGVIGEVFLFWFYCWWQWPIESRIRSSKLLKTYGISKLLCIFFTYSARRHYLTCELTSVREILKGGASNKQLL